MTLFPRGKQNAILNQSRGAARDVLFIRYATAMDTSDGT